MGKKAKKEPKQKAHDDFMGGPLFTEEDKKRGLV